MKKTLIIGNFLAAVGLLFLGGMATSAHRTHAYSVYRELQSQHVLVERADFDIRGRLETIAAGGAYSLWIAYIGASVSVVDAVVIGLFFKNASREGKH